MRDHRNVSSGPLAWRFLGKGKGLLASSLNAPQVSKRKRSLTLPTGQWCLSTQFCYKNWPVLSDQPNQASGESGMRLIRGARGLWLASVTPDKQQAQKREVLGLPESPRFKSQPADSGSCSTKPETSTGLRAGLGTAGPALQPGLRQAHRGKSSSPPVRFLAVKCSKLSR